MRTRASGIAWGALAVAAALLPLRGVFTTSRLFFLRDLHGYFWPHHLWLREAMRVGRLPLWDPNPGLGYAVVSDPALQMFFPPVLLLRLLLPALVGFNLGVALPFPLAAAGMFVFLRASLKAPAAALGALTYAASGPILSTASCTNLAWTAAFIPWVMASVDRLRLGLTAGRLAASAVLLALSFLAGEPVAALGTMALAVAYAALGAGDPRAAGTGGLRPAVRTVGASILGMAMAAVQAIPLWDASRRSIRGAGLLQDTWALHPLRLFELLLPSVFGDYFGPGRAVSPWLWPLNSGREPYLFSLYVGPIPLLLAWRAVAAGRRRFALFWAAAGVIALLCALGEHGAVYSWLRSTVAPLRALRYPEKYTVFAAFALAALSAVGWHELSAPTARSWRRTLLLALPAALLIVMSLFALSGMDLLVRQVTALAASVGLQPVDLAASRLLHDLGARLPRLVALLVVAALLLPLGASARGLARSARGGLFALAAADLLATNAYLNPTLESARLGPPPWLPLTREQPEARVFIAQDLFGDAAPDPDHPPRLVRGDLPLPYALALYTTNLPSFPTAWGVREALSADLTGLRPREYLTLLEQYDRSDRAGRTRLLQRLGTRFFIGPRPPSPDASVLMRLPNLAPLALYESLPVVPRVSVVPTARAEADVAVQIAALADPQFDPRALLLVDAEPSPAGPPGRSAVDDATIVSEHPDHVAIRTRVARSGGYLLLLDAYDDYWTVEVDGGRAELLRANGVFRAVRLEAGEHLVAFAYRPRPFYWGTAISGATGLLFMAVLLSRSSRHLARALSRRPPQG